MHATTSATTADRRGTRRFGFDGGAGLVIKESFFPPVIGSRLLMGFATKSSPDGFSNIPF
jgi:hypothetical protein